MQRVHNAEHLQRTEFLRVMELAGWPSVESEDLSSATMRAKGRMGPGRTYWEGFGAHAPLAQLRHLRYQLEYNGGLFHRSDDAPARRRRAETLRA